MLLWLLVFEKPPRWCEDLFVLQLLHPDRGGHAVWDHNVIDVEGSLSLASNLRKNKSLRVREPFFNSHDVFSPENLIDSIASIIFLESCYQMLMKQLNLIVTCSAMARVLVDDDCC